jgi:hypothetical protein
LLHELLEVLLRDLLLQVLLDELLLQLLLRDLLLHQLLLHELLLKLFLNELLQLLLNHLLLETRQPLLLLRELRELKLHKHLLVLLAEVRLHSRRRRELLHIRGAEAAACAGGTAAGSGRTAAPLRVLHALCRRRPCRPQQRDRCANARESKPLATRHGHLDSAKAWRSGKRLRPDL